MSVYPVMSQSNLNYFLGLMAVPPYNQQIFEFGPWDSVSFLVSNSSDPDDKKFKVVTVWGTAPSLQVVPESSPPV